MAILRDFLMEEGVSVSVRREESLRKEKGEMG